MAIAVPLSLFVETSQGDALHRSDDACVRDASDPQMTGGTVKDEAKHAARFRCRWPIRPKRGVVSPIPNRAEA